MSKDKTGLHTQVTEIFDGVKVNNNDAAPSLFNGAASEKSNNKVPSHLKPTEPGRTTDTPKTRQTNAGKTAKPKKRIEKSKAWTQILNKLSGSKTGAKTKKQKIMTLLVPVLCIGLPALASRLGH